MLILVQNTCIFVLLTVGFPGDLACQRMDINRIKMEEKIVDVQALLDHLNISDGYIFFGHSRGAENALMLAAKLKVKYPFYDSKMLGFPKWLIYSLSHDLYCIPKMVMALHM